MYYRLIIRIDPISDRASVRGKVPDDYNVTLLDLRDAIMVVRKSLEDFPDRISYVGISREGRDE